jgi:hypothetical protein
MKRFIQGRALAAWLRRNTAGAVRLNIQAGSDLMTAGVADGVTDPVTIAPAFP